MQMTSTSTSAAVPKGPSSGATMTWTSSNGLALAVSITCTGTAGGGACAGEETADPGLPGSCVIVGAAGAVPPGSSCFNSSNVWDSFVKTPPLGSSKACILVTM